VASAVHLARPEAEHSMKIALRDLWHEEQGQDMTEYALLLVLVALAAISTMGPLAKALRAVFRTAGSDLSGTGGRH
jgi:Flp pilus assembly pilin Flp